MRIANVAGRLSLVDVGGMLDVEKASDGRFSSDPSAVYARWDEFREWADSAPPPDRPLDAAPLGPPSAAPRQVFATALNYAAHASEGGHEVPAAPLMFTKFPTCLVGAYDEVTIDSQHVDWEVELVVVIGREAYKVPESSAWSHVAGVTVGQDISDRKVQHMGSPPQFSMGKSFPGFGPTGPWLVTPDELSDPDDLEISCSIDGEMVQKSRTSMMIFSVPELIAHISGVCPLTPGDLIFTGTPEGVGARARPPRFLRAGNVVTSRISDIGEMRNAIVAASPSHAG